MLRVELSNRERGRQVDAAHRHAPTFPLGAAASGGINATTVPVSMPATQGARREGAKLTARGEVTSKVLGEREDGRIPTLPTQNSQHNPPHAPLPQQPPHLCNHRSSAL
jgi:hypothetical protein